MGARRFRNGSYLLRRERGARACAMPDSKWACCTGHGCPALACGPARPTLATVHPRRRERHAGRLQIAVGCYTEPVRRHCTSAPMRIHLSLPAQVVPPTGGGEDDDLYHANFVY